MINASQKKIKVGLMGGTFNPIHNAHLELAKAAMSECGLDEVWFLLSKLPAHKSNESLANEQNRSDMVNLAIEKDAQFKFCDIELKREGNTYTADTARILSEKYPEFDFYLIMGGDSALYFERWIRPEEIVKYFSLIIAGRSGIDTKVFNKCVEDIKNHFGARVYTISMQEINISSSEIRKCIHDGHTEELHTLLPEKVLNYINQYRLYKDYFYSKEEISNLIENLRNILPEERFVHSLGVAYTAASLGMRYNVDHNKLLVAGLLHDCSKYMPSEEILKKCLENNLSVCEGDIKNPGLAHSLLSEYYAKTVYGIYDEDILSGIRNHTTGTPGMSLFDTIVYLADYLEPCRNFIQRDFLDEARKLAFENIYCALEKVLDKILSDLYKRGSVIDDRTEKTRDWIKERNGVH